MQNTGFNLTRSEKIKVAIIFTILAAITAIGTIELLQVLSTELNLSGLFWSWLNTINFEMIGFGIIGIFIVSWLASFGYWRYKKYDKLDPFSQTKQPQINSKPN